MIIPNQHNHQMNDKPDNKAANVRREKRSQRKLLTVPRSLSFDLPEGTFDAVVSAIKYSVKPTKKGAEDWVRILFDVHVPDHTENSRTMAGRNFKLTLNEGSDLRNFLTGILGDEFFKSHEGDAIDLED